MVEISRRRAVLLLGGGSVLGYGTLAITGGVGSNEPLIPNSIPVDGCSERAAWPTLQRDPKRNAAIDQSMKRQPALRSEGGPVNSISGRAMVVCTDEYVIWHLEQGKTVHRYHIPSGRVDSLSLQSRLRVYPAIHCSLLGVHTKSTVYWIDIDEWNIVSKTSASTPLMDVLVDDDFAYLQLGGGIQTFAVDTGEPAWSLELEWTAVGISSSDERVFVIDATAGEGGTLTALEKGTGEIRWTTDVIGETYSSPVVGNAVYVLNNEGTLYALEAETGDLEWRERVTDTPDRYTIPAVRDGTVYVSDESGGQTVALDAETGERTWEAPIPRDDGTGESSTTLSAPVCTPESVLVGAAPGGLVALSQSDGTTQWQASSHSIVSNLVMNANGVYALSPDGVVAATDAVSDESST